MLKNFFISEEFDRDHELKVVGSKLTYEDSEGIEYSVSFAGPGHHQRARAYCKAFVEGLANLNA